jgi:SAM-dependent methyltransferase
MSASSTRWTLASSIESDAKMAKEIKRFTGTIPENYQRYLVPLLFDPYARHLVEVMTPVDEGAVLELACGTGALSRLLRRHLPDDVRLVATDVAPGMLEIAKRELGSIAGLEFQIADAMDLPFPDASFGTVICQFGIMMFPDKRRGLAEMLRVLRPGGRAYVSMWDDVAQNELMNMANQAVQALNLTGPINFLGGFSYTSTDQIKSDFDAAGFEDVEISTVKKTSEAPMIDFAVSGIVDGTSLASQLDDQGLLDTGRQAIREKFDIVFCRGTATGEMQALFCTATKPK